MNKRAGMSWKWFVEISLIFLVVVSLGFICIGFHHTSYSQHSIAKHNVLRLFILGIGLLTGAIFSHSNVNNMAGDCGGPVSAEQLQQRRFCNQCSVIVGIVGIGLMVLAAILSVLFR